jgi:glycine cleavage system transcriptional repressor
MSTQQQQFAIAAMGRDRPGIVAGVGEALRDAGVNIDDSSMTILGGQFAMLLVVEGDVSVGEIERVLGPVVDQFGLSLDVRAAERHALSDDSRDDYVVAAYGPDQRGLVSSMARVLADAEANINDFGSRLGGEQTFAMWFNVSLPEEADVASLERQLVACAGDLGLDVRIHRAEAEEL